MPTHIQRMLMVMHSHTLSVPRSRQQCGHQVCARVLCSVRWVMAIHIDNDNTAAVVTVAVAVTMTVRASVQPQHHHPHHHHCHLALPLSF